MVSVLYRHAQNLRHVYPQNRLSLKEFETTTREIGLIIFPGYSGLTVNSNAPFCLDHIECLIFLVGGLVHKRKRLKTSPTNSAKISRKMKSYYVNTLPLSF